MVTLPFHTIMVAIDESDISENAFVAAKELAKALSAKLILVHVLDPHSSRGPQSPYDYYLGLEDMSIERDIRRQYEREWAEFVRYYESLLKQKADEAIADGIETDFLQPNGPPGSTLCKIAKTANASLMVIGSHQRRGIAEIMLGSTSNYITHYAPCSVMVVYANDVEEFKIEATRKMSVDPAFRTVESA